MVSFFPCLLKGTLSDDICVIFGVACGEMVIIVGNGHSDPSSNFVQSAGAVGYTDCFSAEGYDPTPIECSGYDTKQSDG